MRKILVVSCLFTSDSDFGIYPAPIANNTRCVFFTNREEIATRAKLAGWEPCLMPFPLCADPLELSLQSKAVKFISFWGWSCHAYVPVSELIYAAFRSNAKGLLPPSDEWRRRGL